MENNSTDEHNVSTKDTNNEETIKSVKFSTLEPAKSKTGKDVNNMDMLMDVQIPVLVELGRTELLMQDVLSLNTGAIIELDSLAGEPVKMTIRGKIIAYGEVVVVDENFGVKITKIADPQDKTKGGW
ncbi:MAG: flagellar motor switch protein FliN [Candidatus Scalindua sp.]|jgi:flagellar motor switch protein FliN/FliY|nr:flagellar motor switch protein FliN [Candidatus Scalindua sp.]